MILKRMKRRHSRADTIRFCEDVRRLRPGAAFGADLIVGFPTETEPMFENSLALIEEAGLSYTHVFPYSARKGTPAARMPQLQRDVIKERAARLRLKGATQLDRHLRSLIGSEQQLLIEKDGFGRTQCFAQADIAGAPASIVRARVTAVVGARLRVDQPA